MLGTRFAVSSALAAALLSAAFANPAAAKDKVKVSFIGPLTGGTAANGLGGRNSAELAVRLRNADPKAKYEYELVVLDDECKPNVAVQVATKAGADRGIVASVSHYCSVAAIAAVDTYNRLGLPMVVWGAVLPDITYRNKYAGGASRQRHDDQPERDRGQVDGEPRLQALGQSSTTPPTTARGTTSTSRNTSSRPAARSSAPSASPPTSRTSPPS